MDTLEAWRAVGRELAARFAPRAAVWDRERRYCHENVAEMTAAGVMGMTLPTALGGRGASILETVVVVEEIAKACTLSARIAIEANLGGIAAVMAYGTEAQRQMAAALVLAGDKPAICITEPGAGSAASQMQATARRTAAGWRLSGEKCWITGGGVSRLHLILARAVEADGTDLGIGGFLMVADPAAGEMPEGFEIAGHERTMGLCGMPEAHLVFRDMRIPEEMVLAPPGGFARGFAAIMSAYNSQRVGAAAAALGVGAGAFEAARDYLLAREQFGRPLAEFQGLQWMLAEMDAKLHAARGLIHTAAASQGPDPHFPDLTAAARAKLFATQTAVSVVSDALQMHGARGYGAETPLERMYRDVRMFTIGGGTVEVLRTQLAGALLGIKTPQTREGYADLARLRHSD
ncbi:MAG: acyl-CoA dehydrogenase family protein [Pseudomonadota bacterium]